MEDFKVWHLLYGRREAGLAKRTPPVHILFRAHVRLNIQNNAMPWGRSGTWGNTQLQGILEEDFKREMHVLGQWHDQLLVRERSLHKAHKLMDSTQTALRNPQSPTSVLHRPDTASSEGSPLKDAPASPVRPATGAYRPATTASRPHTSASRPATSASQTTQQSPGDFGGSKSLGHTIPDYALDLLRDEEVKTLTSYRLQFMDPTPHDPFGPFGEVGSAKTFFKPKTTRGVYHEHCIKNGQVPTSQKKK